MYTGIRQHSMQEGAETDAASSTQPTGQPAWLQNSQAHLEGLQVGSEIPQQSLCLLRLEVRLTPDGSVKAGKALCINVGSLADSEQHSKNLAA